MAQVGWIGLGAMGRPMAARLLDGGHALIGYDVDRAAAAALGDRAKAAGSPAEAAAGCDVLAVMVATGAQAEEVLFGDQGAAPALRKGAVVLVTATVGPAAVQGMADRLAGQGVHVVDAPVSGGVARATTGELLMMVSGPEAALAVVQPLLDAMSSRAPVVGATPGDGQKVKLVNQLLCGVHIAAAAEGLAYAEALGLDAEACWEVIRHGAAASFMLDDRGERMVHGAGDQVKSAIDIFVKDLGLVLAAARENVYPAPLASVAEQLYLTGRRAGLGSADDSKLIEVLRGRR
ncbi:putative dehydrogenase [Geodermatophilus obscurus]|uniref:Putative dehydrogenase n=1 Tax=Geodermatophilus obscurus TaxID=1861 RepID=A0A1M7RWZ9_9ACTN|nr:NAD(P)-dependent oxidoreductase [Geodermatophilus obscurus]SHN50803.1 putative dehydrogenase [Geodermatophilus obscurus]